MKHKENKKQTERGKKPARIDKVVEVEPLPLTLDLKWQNNKKKDCTVIANAEYYFGKELKRIRQAETFDEIYEVLYKEFCENGEDNSCYFCEPANLALIRLRAKYNKYDIPEVPGYNCFSCNLQALIDYCTTANIAINTSKEKDTKEQLWKDYAPDYMSNSEAIVNFTKGKMPLPTLTAQLKRPDNKIRFMRKGQRCKVHIGDFREYASQQYVPDKLANEIADEILAEREFQQLEEDIHKRKTGK